MAKILIADDESLIRSNIKDLLDPFQTIFKAVYEAEDGVDALFQIKEHQPEIVLFDINMPFLNGLDAIKKIRQQDKNIILIIISGYSKFEYAKEAIANQVYAYLLKPINEKEFHETIQSAIDCLHGQCVIPTEAERKKSSEHQVVQYIVDHLANTELNVNAVCNHFHLSSSSFARLIKKQTGHTFTDYLTKLRMERAIHLLEHHDELTIKEISARSGYKNQHYFSRAFKNFTGMSPKKYKESFE